MDGESLTVFVADTPDLRAQGLQDVDSLPNSFDGMIFTYERPATTSYGMRDVQFPLDIWWFDEAGALSGSAGMDTCSDGECVSYGSPGPIMWALETVAGEYTFAPGSVLVVDG